ncbi:MAG: lipopolysaccharide transport periplasmic protein LptA [Paracoccaceae bacterium]
MRPPVPVLRLLFFLGFGVLPAFVAAQDTRVAFGGITQDTDAPVEVSAENLSVDQSDGTAIFTEDVLIVQGEMRLSAQRVLVVYDENDNDIARLEATGGVTLVSGEDAAEAERADYDIEAGTIVLTGEVLLTQGRNVIGSERMVVNLEDGAAELSGRVRTVLSPGEE